MKVAYSSISTWTNVSCPSISAWMSVSCPSVSTWVNVISSRPVTEAQSFPQDEDPHLLQLAGILSLGNKQNIVPGRKEPMNDKGDTERWTHKSQRHSPACIPRQEAGQKSHLLVQKLHSHENKHTNLGWKSTSPFSLFLAKGWRIHSSLDSEEPVGSVPVLSCLTLDGFTSRPLSSSVPSCARVVLTPGRGRKCREWHAQAELGTLTSGRKSVSARTYCGQAGASLSLTYPPQNNNLHPSALSPCAQHDWEKTLTPKCFRMFMGNIEF